MSHAPSRILLLSSAFNGLSQRIWCELREAGHYVTVEIATGAANIREAAALADPDLIICPYLTHRVPTDVWQRWRTVIIHPGPVGDRGPSSLDWAILRGQPEWGVTALQAVDDLDAGPVWAEERFRMPDGWTKSEVYAGPVTDAAARLAHRVARAAMDPTFSPTPVVPLPELTPACRQADRAIDWSSDTTADILRRVRASDGQPGVLAQIGAQELRVFDAHPGPRGAHGPAGEVLGVQDGGVLVGTMNGAIWFGQARGEHRPAKLPAASLLDLSQRHPVLLDQAGATGGPRAVSYRQHGDLGLISWRLPGGAMNARACRRIARALRHAADQPTKAIVLANSTAGPWSHGIDLNAIEASANPGRESWSNINAINDLAREILTLSNQVTIAALGGSTGAGGVTLAAACDLVIARGGIVLNPHYATMGLFGSEYWTYVLPRRVGREAAERLTRECLPVSPATAVCLGLIDRILDVPAPEFVAAALELAGDVIDASGDQLLDEKWARRVADERAKPLDAYRAVELGEMARTFFDPNADYHRLRREFVGKTPWSPTPPRLALHRRSDNDAGQCAEWRMASRASA
jgi:putative two-component system protein, hydrogenase maturation factor HypX/HoxX